MNHSHHDTDIPVLTDVIDEETQASDPAHEARHPHDDDAELLRQIGEEISTRITAELSAQIPVLMEAALREHLPRAIGARLQADIMAALATTLPSAAQAATEQVAGSLVNELGPLLEQRMQSRVREVVAQEFARLQHG